MQRLLAIEIDILTGIGENNMKNLWVNPKHERSNTAVKVQLNDFNISQDDSKSSLGNLQKLKYIEQELDIFYKVFTSKPSHSSNIVSLKFVSQEIGNDIKPSRLDDYQRYGMSLSRKDQLQHYISYLKGLQAEYE